MQYVFSQSESSGVIRRFGKEFFEKLSRDVQTYSEKWKLEVVGMVDSYSVNCIFICRSREWGDAILKIGKSGAECFTEANCLREYNGGRFCKLLDADIENGIMLQECIKPGTRLRDEQSLEKRLRIFSELYRGLHIAPRKSEIYPTYLGWVRKITDYMNTREDHQELYRHMKRAERICSALCDMFSEKMLLHGDLHHDNILLAGDGQYRIIDPKGVIGDPIFDIPRFILNEFYDVYASYEHFSTHIQEIAGFLHGSLGAPIDVIKKCLFIETAMANCWNVESGIAPDIQSVAFAQMLMDAG